MSKRDSLFLSGSVGRTGVPVQRTASFESLSAHPLLSPPIPSPSGSSTDSHSPTQTPATRYVPYTPRQRGAPIAATTGTTMHPSVTVSATPHAHPSQGDAASKLQLMNLKAAAQRAGLDAASAGWAILERLAAETDHGAEWNELWSALSAGKATLLLPTEPQPAGEPVTAAFVKDHIALCDASAASRTMGIITLSGLRGTLADNTLTFRSTLSPSSKAFQALLMPATRASALAALPPLPPPKGPPLPPRPSARPVTHSPQPHPAARLSNPFASLFGRATSSPTPPASPTAGAVPLHAELAAQPTSSTPPDASTAEPPSPATVPAYTIGARIQRGRVLGSLARAMRAELDQVLAAGDVPAWMRERVEEWASWVGPAVPAVPARGGAAANGDARRKVSGAHSGAKDAWEVAGELGGAETGGIEDVARRFQEFYDELAEEVLRHFGERESGRRRTWAGLVDIGKMIV
ncbi:hypothetical protein A0H81_13570 [Grifola frondosa]|uniref:Uncharacterized protein n=1 Tax=Grifola frondosa TaxID=5627 RepID=A0A1C7LP31_GRIFR|nr:hypothetical protein A0H81_13570 [Grifola frondosa]